MINKSLGANGLPHFSIKALELVILCANHHDYEVIETIICVLNKFIIYKTFSTCNHFTIINFFFLLFGV